MIRNRKTINALVEEFKNMKLNPELFPPDWNDVSIYDKVTVNQFKEQCISAEKNSRNSVFKAAQAAPIVIISPRSRGFSNRETIINRYKEQI
jgi:phosphoketolase